MANKKMAILAVMEMLDDQYELFGEKGCLDVKLIRHWVRATWKMNVSASYVRHVYYQFGCKPVKVENPITLRIYNP